MIIRITISLFMAAGLMLLTAGINGALQSEAEQAHLGWRAKTESVAAPASNETFFGRFITSFREIVRAEKEPPKSDLQRLLDRRRRDTLPFDLGGRMPRAQPVNR